MIVINALPFGGEAFRFFCHPQELKVTRVSVEIVMNASEFVGSGLIRRWKMARGGLFRHTTTTTIGSMHSSKGHSL